MSKEKSLQQKNIILLVNLGTPNYPSYWSTLRYLQAFLSDSRVIEIPKLIWYPILYGFILPFRSLSSSKKYQQVYHQELGLPLRYHSEALVNKLQKLIDKEQANTTCLLAMRYAEPNLTKILDSLKNECIRNLFILPLFPQYSATTTATIMDLVGNQLRTWRYLPNIQFINGFWDNPEYINTICTQIQQHWKQQGTINKLLLSYHGLPERNLTKGDPYYCFCHKTTRLIAQRLQLQDDQYEMVFQSRFGPSAWLQPYTEDRLVALAKSGVKKVDVIAPGFVADCLETDDEIAREYKEVYQEAGGEELHYIPAMNATDASAALFMKLIKAHSHFMHTTHKQQTPATEYS